MKAVLDSDIVIDYLNGRSQARPLLSHYDPVISIITYLEVISGAKLKGVEASVASALQAWEVVPLSIPIADLAATIRVEKRLKLPDASIYATAKHLGLLLITRNTKDFSAKDPQVRIPYKL